VDVRALTYNNFRWRRAASDVVALARADGAATSPAGLPGGDLSLPQPFIIVYGHSWGGGSIAKFARLLRDEGLDISLAVYIDAFTVRNPRVPDNVRYAVNFYQRAGLLRGLPLRGKRQLVPESPDATHILGSYRLRPDTDHFGWNWNLIQPLLYRHHHRISHDVRLQHYLVEAVGVLLETVADAPVHDAAPLTAAAGT
jgi:pimeloyl-ACP methyl ester carboxylesterase